MTPLSGGLASGAPCYLLEIDDCTLLLDCGWDMSMDSRQLELLGSVAERVDAVLISHASLSYIGALPYAVEKLGLTATVYATLPVARMGTFLFLQSGGVYSLRPGLRWEMECVWLCVYVCVCVCV